MRFLKRLIRVFIVVLIIFIGALITIPYFFKDEIISTLETEINKNLNANVDFESVDISLLKAFPNLCVGIHQLKVAGRDKFEGIQLIGVSSLEMTLNILSLFKRDGPITMRRFKLEEPTLNLLVLEDGSSNYDIVKEDSSSSPQVKTESSYQLHLHQYEIIDAQVLYRDESSDILLQMSKLNHTGKGDFTSTVFDLDTETHIGELTAKMQNISYLSKVTVDYHAKIKVDLNEMSFTLQDNEMTLNDLILSAAGQIQIPDDDLRIAMDIAAPTNNFKSIWSLIPGAFIQDYEQVKAQGKFSFKATINGSFNADKQTIPSFSVELRVDDGAIQYPEFPMGISSINTYANLKNSSNRLNALQLDIPSFSFALGQNKVSGNMQLSKPVSNPTLQMSLQGNMNLEDFSRAFPMESVSELSGILTSNFNINGTWLDMENAAYDRISASGFLQVDNLRLKQDQNPAMGIQSGRMAFTPQAMQIENFESTLGRSDIQLKGKITNYLAFFSQKKNMTGEISLRSRKIDMNEWIKPESEDSGDPEVTMEADMPFDRFDLDWEANIGELIYEDFILEEIKGRGQIRPNELVVRGIQFKIGKSDFQGNGTVNNALNYLYKNEILEGQIIVNSGYCDLNEIMGVDTSTTAEGSDEEPFPIPEKISMTINASMDEVIYTNMRLTNLKGIVAIDDRQAIVKNLDANTLGGNIQMAGTYNTQNSEAPVFKLDYTLKNIDFKQAFNTFNTFQKLAPIAQFLSGSFNTNMTMNGKIGRDMLPVLMSVNADGFLQTFNSILSNFTPFRKLGRTLNIDALDDMVIRDVKTWFEVREGRVEVKEFPYVWKGIDMRIKGNHGIDQSMDYNIKMNIPKSLIQNTPLKNAVDGGMTILSRQAKKMGINIAQSEFIKINVGITGSIGNPKIGIQLTGADGSGAKVVSEIKERTKDVIDKTIDSTKKVVTGKVQDKKEELKAKADKEIAVLMQKAQETADQLRLAGYKLADEAQKKGYAQADELVKKAGNNPLKKIAAKEAAKVLKKETDKKVQSMKSSTDKKAKIILDNATVKADQIRKKYGVAN